MPATTAQGWSWLAIAVVGFIAGQILSSLLLVVVAAANGQLPTWPAWPRAVPPAWIVVGGLAGLWAGFLGLGLRRQPDAGTGTWWDMGLWFRPGRLLVGP